MGYLKVADYPLIGLFKFGGPLLSALSTAIQFISVPVGPFAFHAAKQNPDKTKTLTKTKLTLKKMCFFHPFITLSFYVLISYCNFLS